ncbi:ATP-grasp domain-containing protein [Actinophytocola xanthii]|uniref:ATP-grasp domain-containing protein n=1 Tax=Actinophytocola xanthii TaxID=1912961 RepID=A0A1Q8CVY8_9PSEU|nr:hypothetical protein [Actinophytocola xanthii]OLF18502.1 hypothetical protein BU204_05985 [Actinophytocola xanthii]
MKARVGVVLSPRGAATVRDILLAAGEDIEVVALLRPEVRLGWPGFAGLVERLFGRLVEVDEDHLDVPGGPLRGVVTFADAELELAAAIGRHLGVRHRRAEPADKLLQRRRLHDAGLSAVTARPLAGPEDLSAARAELGLPFVVKPRRGAGGAHVVVVDSERRCAEVQRSWSHGVARYAEGFIPTATSAPRSWRADYVSVEVQSVGGHHEVITLFGKLPVVTREGQIATTGDLLPCGLSPELRGRVEDLVLAAHRALELDDGVSHTEVKLGAAGPEVIEVNCRVGGHLSRLLNRRHGFDLVRQALLVTAGLAPRPLPVEAGTRAVAGMFVPFASVEGPVRSRVSPAELRAAGAAAVDELAREGAPRSYTDGIACNVVLDREDEDELRRTAAGLLARVGELFAADGIGRHDWTEDMIELLAVGEGTPVPGRGR